MKDLLIELLKARNNIIYKSDDFINVLKSLKSLDKDNAIEWDMGAGEEWAFCSNSNFTIMLTCKIGICFVQGILDNIYYELLNKLNIVFVGDFSIEEWYVDLDKMKENVPEIFWHSSMDIINPNRFSLNDLYYATI